MGTLQNPSPNPYPNRRILPHSSPIPNPNPSPNPNPNRSILPYSNPTPNSPSFEEVSKLFSLPLSDAAESLGVCPSVLKTVCYDNGLVRWPYRKFLSGKSIEEIKKDAAVEKEKQLAELKNAGERGPQSQSTSAGSLQGTPTIRMLTQPPTIDNRLGSSRINSSTMNRMNSPVSDEFKYGFPSDGLSSITYRWWGNKSADEIVVDSKEGGIEDADGSEQQPKESEGISAANLSSMDVEAASESEKCETGPDPLLANSLSALRRKMARDGQQALKLGGVYRGYSVKTLDRAKKHALLQIFRSSLPREWGDMSSES